MTTLVPEEQPLQPELRAIDPTSNLVLVQLPDQIAVFEVMNPWMIRCTAAISGNGDGPSALCRVRLEDRRLGKWVMCMLPAGGQVRVYTNPRRPERYQRQVCNEHVETDIRSFPEWVPFDPEVHKHLIKRASKSKARRNPVPLEELVPLQRSQPRPARRARLMPHAELRTALYRWFDADDVLLYIGITKWLAERTDQHDAGSSWFQFVARGTVDWSDDWAAAEEAEIAAIQAEEPLFNEAHADLSVIHPRLVKYLVDKGRYDLLAPAFSRA